MMIQLYSSVTESIENPAYKTPPDNAPAMLIVRSHAKPIKNETLQRRWALIAANESSYPDQCHLHTASLSLSIYKFLRTTLLRQSMLAWMSCCKNKQVY